MARRTTPHAAYAASIASSALEQWRASQPKTVRIPPPVTPTPGATGRELMYAARHRGLPVLHFASTSTRLTAPREPAAGHEGSSRLGNPNLFSLWSPTKKGAVQYLSVQGE